jgi:hypothetical protein
VAGDTACIVNFGSGPMQKWASKKTGVKSKSETNLPAPYSLAQNYPLTGQLLKVEREKIAQEAQDEI